MGDELRTEDLYRNSFFSVTVRKPVRACLDLHCVVLNFVSVQADFPTVIGVTLDREDGSTPMETDGDKGKQSGTTYYIDTNQLRVPRENMEVMSPLKNGMSEFSMLSLYFAALSLTVKNMDSNVIA